MAVERDPSVARLANFSDAVVAIALTVLVLPLSTIDPGQFDDDVVQIVLGNSSKFAAFLLSFWVISFFWLAHFHLFRRLARVDYGILALNLLWLLVIAFIPFPTYLLGTEGLDGYDDSISHSALLLYISTDLAGWALKTAMHHHAQRKGLLVINDEHDAHKVTVVGRRNVVVTLSVVALLILAIALPELALVALALLLFAVPLSWLVEWAIHLVEEHRAR